LGLEEEEDEKFDEDGIILVADLMRSITIFTLNEKKPEIVELSRDSNSLWSVSACAISMSKFILFDNEQNAFVFKRVKPINDEQRVTLKVRKVNKCN
jgi:hypothetical protein